MTPEDNPHEIKEYLLREALPAPEKLVERVLERMNIAKQGVLINVHCWTVADGSGVGTGSQTLERAVEFLKAHERFYANWQITFISEKGVKYTTMEEL